MYDFYPELFIKNIDIHASQIAAFLSLQRTRLMNNSGYNSPVVQVNSIPLFYELPIGKPNAKDSARLITIMSSAHARSSEARYSDSRKEKSDFEEPSRKRLLAIMAVML